MSAVIDALVEQGVVEEIAGEGVGERSDLKYRRVPPVPVPQQRGRGRGHPEGVANRDRAERTDALMMDLEVMKPENEEKQSQSKLEKLFAEFFQGVVSEWNPCFTDDGRWRYKWDEEIGAHDVEGDAGLVDDTDVGGEPQTSEQQALRDVSARAPDRVNLRGLLDKIFGGGDEPGEVDVQRVRRLVAALVNRVARHTKHGVDPPKLCRFVCMCTREGKLPGVPLWFPARSFGERWVSPHGHGAR